MGLMKLRMNFPLEDLGHRFGVSRTTASNCFLSVAYFLSQTLYEGVVRRKTTNYCRTFASMNPDSATQIWDCTDLFVEAPRKDLENARASYSSYRSGYTFKFLIATAADGAIVFVSDLFGGSVSDKEIVKECGVLDTLQEGDLVLADKGFLVHDLLPPGVRLNIPSFLDSSTRQFSEGQVSWSRNIATKRVHVERAIGRMKRYCILSKIPHDYRKHALIFVKCIAALVNLQNPLIKS